AEGFLQVGRGASVAGRVTGRGVVLLHGRLSGEIALEGDLVIAPGGEASDLRGRLDRLRIEGRCRGSLTVTGPVELARGASFEGEVDAEQLETSEGARFEGVLRIRPDRTVGGGAPEGS
ncbi:MAG: polymer-forming cytoskeletal protein, partial [Acidobacteria bacterium]